LNIQNIQDLSIKLNNNKIRNVANLFENFKYFKKLIKANIQLNNNYISEIECFENNNVEDVIFEIESNELETVK
jgi:hypothetical protein